MMEAVTTPELAAEITLMPLKRFPLDAAILFSDLTVPFTAMGAPFELKENLGPVIHEPIRSEEDFRRLTKMDPDQDLSYVLDTIRILKRELRVPLIGFCGAPFTWASYMVEGGPSKDLKRTRALMFREPALWHRLLAFLADNAAAYLRAQLEAGADAVQVFDSWIGNLDEWEYREFVLPHMRTLFSSLENWNLGARAPNAESRTPITIHFGTGNPALLPAMQDAGGTVLGVDWRISLTRAAALLPRQTPLQGNLDPALLLAGGPLLRERTIRILDEGESLKGHIFNLGHGIYPDTPLAHMEELLDIVSSRSSGTPVTQRQNLKHTSGAGAPGGT